VQDAGGCGWDLANRHREHAGVAEHSPLECLSTQQASTSQQSDVDVDNCYDMNGIQLHGICIGPGSQQWLLAVTA